SEGRWTSAEQEIDQIEDVGNVDRSVSVAVGRRRRRRPACEQSVDVVKNVGDRDLAVAVAVAMYGDDHRDTVVRARRGRAGITRCVESCSGRDARDDGAVSGDAADGNAGGC